MAWMGFWRAGCTSRPYLASIWTRLPTRCCSAQPSWCFRWSSRFRGNIRSWFCILLVSGVLYTIAGLRDFRPSMFGKANTFSQLAAVVFVILLQIDHARWVWIARTVALRATFMFTIVSGLHYVYLVGIRLREMGHE
jgi:hypothetical protein